MAVFFIWLLVPLSMKAPDFSAAERFHPYFILAGILFAALANAEIAGRVLDPSGAPVARAEVRQVVAAGTVRRVLTGANGRFAVPDAAGTKLVISAPGFASQTADAGGDVTLEIAAVRSEISVAASLTEAPAAEQPSRTAVWTRTNLRERNEGSVADVLRLVPGLAVVQTGARGGVTGLFARGGESDYNLVTIDGIPVNQFGGGFDFATLPVDQFERMEVVRGPQSALFGSYANGAVVALQSREPGAVLGLDLLAEGGNYGTRRFAAGASGVAAGFGWTGSASKMESDGIVANQDFRRDNVTVAVTRGWGQQWASVRGNFTSFETGNPGPFGSDPAGNFGGVDRVTRSQINGGNYTAAYRWDANARFRQEFSGGFFHSNQGFQSPFGWSYNQDRRGFGEARSTIVLSPKATLVAGMMSGVEQVGNTFITDTSFREVPLDRLQTGIYGELRWLATERLNLTLGVRQEVIRTLALPAGRGADTVGRTNPKLGASYRLWAGARAHGTFGTGIRPPDGFELAFTNNPQLRPERTLGWDAGFEQRLLRDRLVVDVTYFDNRFQDLIVQLGGNLANLSEFQTDNLSNARARGVEIEGRWRPARWITVEAQYTGLDSQVLALDRSTLAPRFFAVGQRLLRRPPHSGSGQATFYRGRFTGSFGLYARSSVLDVEPNFGAFGGLFLNGGYHHAGINLNYRLGGGVTAYANLRNITNRQYEEALGYPALRFNSVVGLKWSWDRER
jgi:outer membrane receptor protein involved in Fe transport